ncbi:hypothetical protein KIN20_021475 [Parelaphostrongylus tenuis]|uniref:Uncharacterized protein n=1 Tax=Parelaphostrongylus tenuis TaxID=148309 RepID=A0AAD5QU78_PARTN|nr:hypothetical protein KIN20_021475 [Parelaphostrongylus tenuis]
MISLLAIISAVLGCGVIPAGQESTRTFTVTGITTLPSAMIYADKPDVVAQVPGIATSRNGAQAFVSRLVMQTQTFVLVVLDVLESQARSALLSDAVISAILAQLSVRITYEPLPCQKVVFDVTKETDMKKDEQFCIILGNTVTGICIAKMTGARNMCMDANQAAIMPLPH